MYTCDIDCVVLGAGQGSRMLDLTGGGAKCLIPVAGHPLLYYSLKILEENGFKSAIVTGTSIYIVYELNFRHYNSNFKLILLYIKWNFILIGEEYF